MSYIFQFHILHVIAKSSKRYEFRIKTTYLKLMESATHLRLHKVTETTSIFYVNEIPMVRIFILGDVDRRTCKFSGYIQPFEQPQ